MKNNVELALKEHFQEVNLTSPDGVHFDLVIKDENLSTMTRMLAHKKVNEILKPFIANGEIHAVSIKIIK